VYGRKLGGRTLSFGHEGVLYRNSFIMYDRGTESLWIHTTGECIKGELEGQQLEFISSVVTSWKKWKAQYPDSLVLEGESDRGFMGTFSLTPETTERFGVSVGQGDRTNLYRVDDLLDQRVIQDRLGADDIVVFFDPDGLHATAWYRGDDNFRWNGSAIVDVTGRQWDMMLGRPKDDPGSQDRMRPAPATVWLIHRWQGFYPNSPIHGGARKESARF